MGIFMDKNKQIGKIKITKHQCVNSLDFNERFLLVYVKGSLNSFSINLAFSNFTLVNDEGEAGGC